MGIETIRSIRCARLRSHGDGRFAFGRRRLRRVVLLAAGLTASACTATPDAATDVRRVVSLAPAITDLVFALGAGDRLVGRTRWDTYPPEALAVPSIGDGLMPNVEAIAARRPDLVLFYATPANTRALEQLANLGIATRELAFDRLADVITAVQTLGAQLGRAREADSVASALEAWLTAPKPGAARRVAFVIADAPLITIGSGSYLSELVERAGAANVFDDLQQPSPLIGLETLAARDPDALIAFGNPDEPPQFLGRPEWQAVRAARERRVVMIEGAHFSYPSVRAPQAARELRAMLEALP